jgi:parallel beta-helix repeat protein
MTHKFALSAFVITLGFAGVAAAKNTPITTCSFVISAPGNYFLANDVGPCPPPFAIQIAASNVRLRLDGHTIACGNYLVGISADSVQKVKIEGPGTITQCFPAIQWTNVDDSEVREVTAPGNGAGFFIEGGTNNRFTENDASSNGGFGIILDGATNTWLDRNIANNTGDFSGITVGGGGGNRLTGNTANNNGAFSLSGFGIVVDSTGNEISGNTALGNGQGDLVDGNPNCDNNDWRNNTFGIANQSCIH